MRMYSNGLCLIISGGDFSPIDDSLKFDYVIACDRGYEYAHRMGLKPDLIIGDFDSAPVPDTDIPVIQFPVHKDDTDTMLAVKHALEKGYKDIVIACAFGGRFDHAFANIQTGAYIAEKGADIRLLGTNTEALIFKNSTHSISRKIGWSLSVFAISDRCDGVSIYGTEYTCRDIKLTNSFPLGVSNEWNDEIATIGVKDGTIMVLQSKMPISTWMPLYAVTDRTWLGDRSLAHDVESALKGGATCIQLREKELSDDDFLEEALEIKSLCHRYNVPFIINDNVEVAIKSDADGIHIGQHDAEASEVRKLIGKDKILGVSAQTVEQAIKAQADGADYLGVGAVFHTGTKLDADDVSYDTLKAICSAVSIPVVAIGGISMQNICKLSGSGIDGIAVVSAIFASQDIEKATVELRDEVKKRLKV